MKKKSTLAKIYITCAICVLSSFTYLFFVMNQQGQSMQQGVLPFVYSIHEFPSNVFCREGLISDSPCYSPDSAIDSMHILELHSGLFKVTAHKESGQETVAYLPLSKNTMAGVKNVSYRHGEVTIELYKDSLSAITNDDVVSALTSIFLGSADKSDPKLMAHIKENFLDK